MFIRVSQKVLISVLPLFLELIGLLFVILIDPYIKKSHRRIMTVNIVLIGLSIVQNMMNDYFSIFGDTPPLRTINSISIIHYHHTIIHTGALFI